MKLDPSDSIWHKVLVNIIYKEHSLIEMKNNIFEKKCESKHK